MRSMTRRRIISALAIALAIVVGLGSRRFGASLPGFVAAYAGDTCWAAAVYFFLLLLAPRLRPLHAAPIALAISYADELSQLYHAPWIDSLRATTLGGLILGFGFLWSDLICYTVGVALATAIDGLILALRPVTSAGH
jgi:hypothetical protein